MDDSPNLPTGGVAMGFKPHAVIQTERSIPSPIFVACLLGPERLLRIDFDPAREPSTYLPQALSQMNLRYPEGGVPAFGWIVGLVINYAPNRAIRFDRKGRALELLPNACRIGTATLAMKGKPLDRLLDTTS